jgi:CBS domain containing-hemolysin-like protein
LDGYFSLLSLGRRSSCRAERLFRGREFALVRVRDSRLVQLEQEGSSRAGRVRDSCKSLDAYLSVCQVGITVASLAWGGSGSRPSRLF